MYTPLVLEQSMPLASEFHSTWYTTCRVLFGYLKEEYGGLDLGTNDHKYRAFHHELSSFSPTKS